MKMGGIGDPFSEVSIQLVIDCDHIRRIRFALHGGNYTTFDPVMDDPEADAISLADLTNIQCSVRWPWSCDVMFVSQPFYRAQRNRFSCRRGFVAFALQQGDDFVVVMVVCQLSNVGDEWRGIADCVRPLLRYLDLQGLGF